ncbi:mannitol dehydrogenase family protein [Salinimonas chungwhensis]|uniref:mannitol dehydrogenase family protein n=1 Tax=Salinimonas chungwhensis TaxID=265425 RepID=UPI0003793A13|nr:mannitol dehydrogenase family protein [Salinimonas chungwhensis]
MTRLTNQSLHKLPANVARPDYDRQSTDIGIVHLGPGAFHRAHQAMYTQQVARDGGQWCISAVSLRSPTLKQALAEQDNLYTLMVLDDEPQVSIVGIIKEILVLQDDRQRVMDRMTARQTAIITLTITEKGYCLNNQGELDLTHADIEHDLAHPDTPVSAIGLLVAALATRRKAGYNELTVVSCDNLPENGDKLYRAVKRFAARYDPAVSQWIAQTISFPNTMVDSITPASDEALEKATIKATGLEDRWPVQREAFSQWVIENNFSGPRPAWENAGVVFTDNVHIFENAKLRVLNGTHSALAYLGSLCEMRTVFDAITHNSMSDFITRLLKQEILPTLQHDAALVPGDYAKAILKRFENKHIHHLLSQIAWDGSQKLPPRILGTIKDNIEENRSISLLCAVVAAWILFVIRAVQAKRKITDPMADLLAGVVTANPEDIEEVGKRILNEKRIFGGLTDNTEFRETVLIQLNKLATIDSDNAEQCLATL